MNNLLKDKLNSKPRSISLINITNKPDYFIQASELKRRQSLSPLGDIAVSVNCFSRNNSQSNQLEKIDEMGCEENQSSIRLTQRNISNNSFLKNSQIQDDKNKLIEIIEDLKQKNNEYQELYQNSLYNGLHLEEKLNNLFKDIEKNQELIMRKDDQIKELQDYNEHKEKEEFKFQENKIDLLINQNSKLEEIILDHESKSSQMKQVIEQFESVNQELRESLLQFQKQSQSKLSRYENQIEILLKQIEDLQLSLTDQQEQTKQQQGQIEQKDQQIKNLEVRIQTVENNHELQLQETTTQIQLLSSENFDLKQEKKQMKKEKDQIVRGFEDMLIKRAGEQIYMQDQYYNKLMIEQKREMEGMQQQIWVLEQNKQNQSEIIRQRNEIKLERDKLEEERKKDQMSVKVSNDQQKYVMDRKSNKVENYSQISFQQTINKGQDSKMILEEQKVEQNNYKSECVSEKKQQDRNGKNYLEREQLSMSKLKLFSDRKSMRNYNWMDKENGEISYSMEQNQQINNEILSRCKELIQGKI